MSDPHRFDPRRPLEGVNDYVIIFGLILLYAWYFSKLIELIFWIWLVWKIYGFFQKK